MEMLCWYTSLEYLYLVQQHSNGWINLWGRGLGCCLGCCLLLPWRCTALTVGLCQTLGKGTSGTARLAVRRKDGFAVVLKGGLQRQCFP